MSDLAMMIITGFTLIAVIGLLLYTRSLEQRIDALSKRLDELSGDHK